MAGDGVGTGCAARVGFKTTSQHCASLLRRIKRWEGWPAEIAWGEIRGHHTYPPKVPTGEMTKLVVQTTHLETLG
jgi:hypothetical protein